MSVCTPSKHLLTAPAQGALLEAPVGKLSPRDVIVQFTCLKQYYTELCSRGRVPRLSTNPYSSAFPDFFYIAMRSLEKYTLPKDLLRAKPDTPHPRYSSPSRTSLLPSIIISAQKYTGIY